MKTLTIGVLILLSSILNLNAQNRSVNCIIFIDGKIMKHEAITGYFSYTDSTNNQRRLDFNYEMGDLILSQENNYLISKLDHNSEIDINLTHHKLSGPDFSYTRKIIVDLLNYRYLVIRITNLNKKTGKYYFGYYSPGLIKPFIKEEYNMFEEYKK